MGIADIKETIESCKHCFMCRHACPTFLATKLDSHTPRGYALLLAEVAAGKAQWSDAIVDRFYQCSQCGLCREDCAYHWPEDELVRNAREEIVGSGRTPARVEQIARAFIERGHPENGGPLPAGPGFSERAGAAILHYAGWSATAYQPAAVDAVRALMTRLGADWTAMADETDTGISLFELGFTKEAARQATALRDRIAGLNPRRVVTGCPHSLWAFRELYGKLGVEGPSGVEFLHVSEFLMEAVTEGTLKPANRPDRGRIAYHDPCRLGRSLGVYDAPRRLIEAVTGTGPVELFHSGAAAECCGAGSVMFLSDPEVSLRVARKRIEAAADEGVETLVTACPNCALLLGRAAADVESRIAVLDIAELVGGSL
jgi:Fe-S oxidoreductase